VSWQELRPALTGVDLGANWPHGLLVVPPSSLVFPFPGVFSVNRQRRTALTAGYSGSAAVLKEEAAQAAFSPPPRCRFLFTYGL
jgi:hypothetical protein